MYHSIRTTVLIAVGIVAALPATVSALGGTGSGGCTGNNCLENPLRFPSLERFVEGVLQAVVMIALPIIVAFMVYAGFKYIFARGNTEGIKSAHENFKYVIIGTILVLGAWVLATLIGGTVTQLLRG